MNYIIGKRRSFGGNGCSTLERSAPISRGVLPWHAVGARRPATMQRSTCRPLGCLTVIESDVGSPTLRRRRCGRAFSSSLGAPLGAASLAAVNDRPGLALLRRGCRREGRVFRHRHGVTKLSSLRIGRPKPSRWASALASSQKFTENSLAALDVCSRCTAYQFGFSHARVVMGV